MAQVIISEQNGSKTINPIRMPGNQSQLMSNVLQWTDEQADDWNYKVKKSTLKSRNDYEKFKSRLNRSSSPWCTEYQDLYRENSIIQEGKNVQIVSSIKQNQSSKKAKFEDIELAYNRIPQEVYNDFYEGKPLTNSTQIVFEKPQNQKSNKTKTIKQKQKAEPTRFLPDTTFSKFYGKPIYHPGYGRCHTKTNLPSEYMQTYNINPQSGSNQPEYIQTFQSAINQAKRRPQTSRPKRVIIQQPVESLDMSELKKDSGILPKKTTEVLNEIQETKLRQSMNISKKQKRKPGVPKTQTKSKVQEQKDKKVQKEPKSIIYQKPEDEDDKLLKQFEQLQQEKLRQQEEAKQQKEKLMKELEEQKEKEYEIVQTEKEKYRLIKALQSKKKSVAKKVNQPKQFNSKEEKVEFEQRKINQLSALGRSLNLSQSNFNQGLSEIEMNPKFYRCMDKQYLEKIPAAGKKIQRGESILNNSDFGLTILKQNA